MAKNRRTDFKEWRKWQIIRRITAMVLIIIFSIVGISKWNTHRKEQAALEEAARIEAEKEQEEKQRKEAIESTLRTDKYKVELTQLYEKYPQMEELLLHREDYSDKLIEYLIGHEEAVDWVVDYPEYMKKTEEEINEIATQPIMECDSSLNGIPLLMQWDQRWGYASYGTGLIASDGCGPTVLSMAVMGLLGDNTVTPKVVADMAVLKGHFVEDVGSNWTLMSEGAEEYGLKSKQIMEWATWAITDELEKGRLVICNVGPGDFTTQGHFILIVGVNEDGTLIINDPNSKLNSEKNWEIQTILDQAKGLWSIGK